MNSKISGHAGSQLYPNATAPGVNGTQYNSYNHFAFNTMVDAYCASGYTELNTNGEITSEWGTHAYKCVNENGRGVWKRMGSCKVGCNEASPVYDVNDLKVSDKMYGIMFMNGHGSAIEAHTYQACLKNEDTSNVITLKTDGSGLVSVRPNDYVKCYYSSVSTVNHRNDAIAKLTCTENNSINSGKPYWKSTFKSCSLEEMKNNYLGIQMYLGYDGYGTSKPLDEIMTTNSKQVRLFGVESNDWNKQHATLKLAEGTSISGTATVRCNSDGNWVVDSSGTIEYRFTGDWNGFTPSKYGAQNKRLTIEAWGANGGSSGASGGRGGYIKGENYDVKNNTISIYIGSTQCHYDNSPANVGNAGIGSGCCTGGGGSTSLFVHTVHNIMSAGGDGGGPNQPGTNGGGPNAGKGATVNSPGAGGSGGSAGSGSQGGAGLHSGTATCGAGSGGGGWKGGGGAGLNSGGGGGSGYCNTSVVNCSGKTGGNDGNNWTNPNGRVKISW